MSSDWKLIYIKAEDKALQDEVLRVLESAIDKGEADGLKLRDGVYRYDQALIDLAVNIGDGGYAFAAASLFQLLKVGLNKAFPDKVIVVTQEGQSEEIDISGDEKKESEKIEKILK